MKRPPAENSPLNQAPSKEPPRVRTREGVVVAIISEQPGLTEAWVQIDGRRERALSYHALTGPLTVGLRVSLNTTAAWLGLGTGGYHFVTAVWGRSQEAKGTGHIMKARYTPSQVRVLSVEEEGGPGHDALREIPDLAGMPVAVGSLHSQVPIVAASVKSQVPGANIVYVMTDGGALPAAFSRVIQSLRRAGILDMVITAGHAFGGDLEAVTVHSALAAAKVVAGADVAIVAMGPGVVGTGTPLGCSALEQGPILDAAADLGGAPCPVVRVSFADPRSRHRGISHHALTVLTRFVHHSLVVPLPRLTLAWQQELLAKQANLLEERGHAVRWLDGAGAYAGARQILADAGISVTTMGRTDREDPAFFEAAAAAGQEIAARLGAIGAS